MPSQPAPAAGDPIESARLQSVLVLTDSQLAAAAELAMRARAGSAAGEAVAIAHGVDASGGLYAWVSSRPELGTVSLGQAAARAASAEAGRARRARAAPAGYAIVCADRTASPQARARQRIELPVAWLAIWGVSTPQLLHRYVDAGKTDLMPQLMRTGLIEQAPMPAVRGRRIVRLTRTGAQRAQALDARLPARSAAHLARFDEHALVHRLIVQSAVLDIIEQRRLTAAPVRRVQPASGAAALDGAWRFHPHCLLWIGEQAAPMALAAATMALVGGRFGDAAIVRAARAIERGQTSQFVCVNSHATHAEALRAALDRARMPDWVRSRFVWQFWPGLTKRMRP